MRERAAGLLAGVLVCVLGGSATLARAQSPSGGRPDRVRVSVNGGWQVSETSFTQTGTFEEHFEQGSLTLRRSFPSGPVYDAALAVRIWRGLELGVAGSYYVDRGGGTVTALIPHPFYFDRHRAVSGEATRVDREELAGHLIVGWVVPLSGPFEFTLSAGPAVFAVEQSLVGRVAYTDSYPFDTAAFDRAVTETVRDTAIGYHAAIDLTWRFSSHVGIGASVRFSRAEENLQPSSGDPVPIRAGGLHAGGGLRLIF